MRQPQIHRQAGGIGTHEDPITLAVGHSMARGHVMDYPAGTRFYFPRIRKYAIVADLCGDGSSPQSGPCHIGKDGRPWVDIYVGGKHAGRAASDACMYRITGFQKAVLHPGPDHPVQPGPLSESGCQVFDGR